MFGGARFAFSLDGAIPYVGIRNIFNVYYAVGAVQLENIGIH